GDAGRPGCNILPAPAAFSSTANDECLVQNVDEAQITSYFDPLDAAALADLNLEAGSGSVAISGTMAGPQGGGLTVSGDIALNGTQYGVDGPVDGTFLGANAEYFTFYGSSTAESPLTITIDGQAGDGGIQGLYGK
ncbi:MAG: hypothetical protein P8X50_17245, partial [Maritimibacter sp.]